MGRIKGTGTQLVGKPVQTEAEKADVLDALTKVDQAMVQAERAQDSARALAVSMGYEGELTIAVLKDGVRFYQQRSMEAVMELGKRLLLLKELIPHGGFQTHLSDLNFSPELARKIMQATRKFSGSEGKNILGIPGISQRKLFELMILDDEEIQELDSGGDVRGVTLDKIDCMSTSELRLALRKKSRELETETVLKKTAVENRDARINALEDELGRKPHLTPEMAEAAVLLKLQEQAMRVVNEIELGLRGQLSQVTRHFDNGPLPNHVTLAMQQTFSQAIQAVRVVAGDFGITLEESFQAPLASLAWLTEAEKVFGDGGHSFVTGKGEGA